MLVIICIIFFRFKMWIYFGFMYDYVIGSVVVYVNLRLVVKRIIGKMEFFINKLVRLGVVKWD